MWAGIRFTAVIMGLFLLVTPAARAADDKAIQAAIDKGVAYLKSAQSKAGTWSYTGGEGPQREIGATALVGLALLENGVAADDRVLQQTTDVLREASLVLDQTYSISLVLLYLDRLGDPGDVPLIESLTVRLLAGQAAGGGWGYNCATIGEPEVRRLRSTIATAKKKERQNADEKVNRSARKLPKEILDQLDLVRNQRVPPPLSTEDNSNTQFATLALWVSRRHGLPVADALKRVALRFRDSQNADGGWDYRPTTWKGLGNGLQLTSSPSNTCAGLLGMAVAYALAKERQHESENRPGASGKKNYQARDPNRDPTIRAGLLFLGFALEAVIDQAASTLPANGGNGANGGNRGSIGPSIPRLKPVAVGPQTQTQTDNPAPFDQQPRPAVPRINNLSITYFLWSLERVAMVYGLETIGKKDWFTKGADFLLCRQEKDGAWKLSYPGPVDTSFALLFLSRSNLVPDLTSSLKGRFQDPAEVRLRAGGIGGEQLTRKDSKAPEEKRELEPKLILDGGRGSAAGSAPEAHSPTAGGNDSESGQLSMKLVRASPEQQQLLLEKLRDSKGAANTDALALAIPQLAGKAKVNARDALAERLARMTAATLRAKMQEDDPEIRRASVLACIIKDDPRFVGDLIPLLEDPEPLVIRAAHVALKKLTGQDFGPSSDADRTERTKSVTKWREWLAAKDGMAPDLGKPKVESTQGDKALLEGTWVLQSLESAGKPATKAQIVSLRLKLVFAGDSLTFHNANGLKKAKIELVADTDPKTIDFITDKEISRGVYELEGDSLKICWAPDGEARPLDFLTSARGKATIYVLKRQQP